MNLYQVVISAINTEKSVKLQENNKFVFFVHKNASKDNIKEAFLRFWGKKVKSINIIKTQPKMKVINRKGKQVKRLARKKAIVSFQNNEKFELLKFTHTQKSPKKNKEVKKISKKK